MERTSMFADGRFQPTDEEERRYTEFMTQWAGCKCVAQHKANHYSGNRPRCNICERQLLQDALCDSEGKNKIQVLILVQNLLCLQEDVWLDDECLENFRAHLGYRNRVINGGTNTAYFFPVQFMSCLVDTHGRYDYQRVKRWTKKHNIFTMAHAVVVVNADENHWVPVVIDMKKMTITYMDSLGSKSAELPEVALSTLTVVRRITASQKYTGSGLSGRAAGK